MPVRDTPGLRSSSEAGDASLYTSIVHEKCNASLRCNLQFSSSHKKLKQKNLVLKNIEPNVPKLSLQYIIHIKKIAILHSLFCTKSSIHCILYSKYNSIGTSHLSVAQQPAY